MIIYAPGTKVDVGFENTEMVGHVNRVMILPNEIVEYEIVFWKDGSRTAIWVFFLEVSIHFDNSKKPIEITTVNNESA